MNYKSYFLVILSIFGSFFMYAQNADDPSLLTIDRVFASSEFGQEYLPPIQWIEEGNAYVIIERNAQNNQEFIRYESTTTKKATFISAQELIPEGARQPISVESFTFSPDKSKILIFNNSSRVWRANTKGDYWVFDLNDKSLKQIGASMPSSSLMFAKFSGDNSKVAYVQAFNLYVENLADGKVTQLTKDGGNGIINGTFDWVYEEEFGCRDGFRWNETGSHIALWNLDASKIGTFYMINNTDSIYSKMIPLQYPKVGQDPSACKVGVINLADGATTWIPLEGSSVQNYIPSIQWINTETILIQRLNRHQNKLTVYTYNIRSKALKEVYKEEEKTWVDIQYPDVTDNGWGDNSLKLVDDNKAFLRLSENDGWRHLYKINIETGEKTLLTEGSYDVASLAALTNKEVYFHASPENSTQRYLYSVKLNGKGNRMMVTPTNYQGINRYDFAPNGKFALHSHSSAMAPSTVRLVSLPKHEVMKNLVKNEDFKAKLSTLKLPEVEFFKVTTEEGIEIDGRMIKPLNFDDNKKYPVLFHVYGEPWGQVATDSWVGMWNIMLAQQGYIVIDMDNRGTPCLKGAAWRKSIYRKIGVINIQDQANAAKEVLKWKFIDPERTAVWGWSGGGSMTLGLLFKHPDIYTTGMSVAPVSNQLIYDNIYQERYMGLPQENLEDFMNGSPITYAKNLEGNLLLVHGTNDDNVHYQSAEMLVNELIKENKQFEMMSYPNRSHGIYEGQNTRRHLYTLLTNYLMRNVPVNAE